MKQERILKVFESKEGFTIREEWKNEDGSSGIGQIFLHDMEIDSIYLHAKLVRELSKPRQCRGD